MMFRIPPARGLFPASMLSYRTFNSLPTSGRVIDSSNYEGKIKQKIHNCTVADARHNRGACNLTPTTVHTLIINQNRRCAQCRYPVLIDYKPYCEYQFSIDKIDNDLPHTAANCRITCLTCKNNVKICGYIPPKEPCKNCTMIDHMLIYNDIYYQPQQI
jgi:hypothetical protein